MEIKRSVFNSLIADLPRREVSIILGPRQVGKTFLLRKLEGYVKDKGLRARYYNLEIPHDLDHGRGHAAARVIAGGIGTARGRIIIVASV